MSITEIDLNKDFAKLFKTKVEAVIPQLITNRRIGIIDVFGTISHELSHSQVIYSLLQPNELDISGAIGNSFLGIVSDVCGNEELKNDHIILVEKEKKTDYGRSIDVNITTEKFNIILENKIYAGDQENQLADYLTFIESTYKDKTAIIVYLTPFGYEPSNYSISREKLEALKKENRFAALSYENDISKWLENIEADGILKHEIEVYRNMIMEDICQMSEAGNLFFKDNYEELKPLVTKNPIGIQKCITGLNLIIETSKNLDKLNNVFVLLKDRYSTVRFVSEQKYLFSDFSAFEMYIVDNLKTAYYGIAVDIDNDIRVGLEYDSNGAWYFGFMKGIDGSPAAISNKQNADICKLTPDWENEGWKIYPSSEWWGECVNAGKLVETESADDIYSWFENQIQYTNEFFRSSEI